MTDSGMEGAGRMQTTPPDEFPGAAHDRRWRDAVAPSGYVNPTPASRYNLVVIGAGPAGLVTSIAAAGLGARVALVERQAMGGDCLNVGCVPSKALLHATAHPGTDFASAFAWLREVRAAIAPHDSVQRYREAGVDVFLGQARFASATSVRVGDALLRTRRTVIATGARAVVPPIPGLAAAAPLTNETVFDLTEQPRRLAILGAGVVGCELAQAFARLGTEVHVFELADRPLPGESAEASAVLADSLRATGVQLHCGAAVERVEPDAGAWRVTAGAVQATADRVLVALGRRANTDGLAPHTAGVVLEENGRVRVDAKLRTTNPRVFAAGDVCADHPFTHNADRHARVVVQNALFAPTARVDRDVVPRCTYTTPEVAAVGASAPQLDAAGTAYDRYRVAFGELDRGRAEGDREGFAEVLTASGSDRILGATIVGHDAGEQVAPLVLMMSRRIGLGRAGGLILPYPTRAEYLKRLGDQYARTRLTPRVAALMRYWLRWRRGD